MTTKPTKIDPRDARIAELERQLAALAPRDQGQQARFERRMAEIRRDECEAEWRALATHEERVRAFVALGDGDRLHFLCVLASYVPGGVVAFARAADAATRQMIYAVHPNSALLRIEVEDVDEQYVRVVAPPGTATCAESPIAISDEHAAVLKEHGVRTEQRGRDQKWFYFGFATYSRPHVDVTADAWAGRLAVDPELRQLVTTGRVVARPLTPDELRAKLRAERAS